MTIVYLGLGSNMGDRIGFLQQALTQLTAHPQVRLLSASSFYETEPVGDTDQEWFVNVAVAIETDLAPEPLLTHCLAVEQQLGRQRQADRPFGPRTVDIDILFYGSLVWHSDSLTLPHPQVCHRAFVLVPLLEVNPRLLHPVTNKTIEQLHQDMDHPEQVYLFGTRTLFENLQ
jgi:2-amino-4-hydroxy-6-hydroxymethyldihydropteridine diphosphokinase